MTRLFLILALLDAGCSAGVATITEIAAPAPEPILCELSLDARSVPIRRNRSEEAFAIADWARVEGALSTDSYFAGSVKTEGVTFNATLGPADLHVREATTISPVITLRKNQAIAIERRDGGYVMRPLDRVLRDDVLAFDSIDPVGAPLDCAALGYGDAPLRSQPPGDAPDEVATAVMRADRRGVEINATESGPVSLRVLSATQADWAVPIVVDLLSRGEARSHIRFAVDAISIEGYVPNDALGEPAERQQMWMCGLQREPPNERCRVTAEAPLWWIDDGSAHQVGTIDPTARFDRGERVSDLLTVEFNTSTLTLQRGQLAIAPSTSIECDAER